MKDPDERQPVPLSFKIMVGLAAVYVGWRIVQGVGWLIDRF
ncbi:MAG: hypothetical protein OEO77_13355 [Acidimicrobiia bacterium]|nr:hypothetical protein [Acidimicrobiia bacterium]